MGFADAFSGVFKNNISSLFQQIKSFEGNINQLDSDIKVLADPLFAYREQIDPSDTSKTPNVGLMEYYNRLCFPRILLNNNKTFTPMNLKTLVDDMYKSLENGNVDAWNINLTYDVGAIVGFLVGSQVKKFSCNYLHHPVYKISVSPPVPWPSNYIITPTHQATGDHAGSWWTVIPDATSTTDFVTSNDYKGKYLLLFPLILFFLTKKTTYWDTEGFGNPMFNTDPKLVSHLPNLRYHLTDGTYPVNSIAPPVNDTAPSIEDTSTGNPHGYIDGIYLDLKSAITSYESSAIAYSTAYLQTLKVANDLQANYFWVYSAQTGGETNVTGFWDSFTGASNQFPLKSKTSAVSINLRFDRTTGIYIDQSIITGTLSGVTVGTYNVFEFAYNKDSKLPSSTLSPNGATVRYADIITVDGTNTITAITSSSGFTIDTGFDSSYIGTWTLNHLYHVGDYVLGSDGLPYRCILIHTSESVAPFNSAPITGTAYATYWVLDKYLIYSITNISYIQEIGAWSNYNIDVAKTPFASWPSDLKDAVTGKEGSSISDYYNTKKVQPAITNYVKNLITGYLEKANKQTQAGGNTSSFISTSLVPNVPAYITSTANLKADLNDFTQHIIMQAITETTPASTIVALIASTGINFKKDYTGSYPAFESDFDFVGGDSPKISTNFVKALMLVLRSLLDDNDFSKGRMFNMLEYFNQIREFKKLIAKNEQDIFNALAFDGLPATYALLDPPILFSFPAATGITLNWTNIALVNKYHIDRHLHIDNEDEGSIWNTGNYEADVHTDTGASTTWTDTNFTDANSGKTYHYRIWCDVNPTVSYLSGSIYDTYNRPNNSIPVVFETSLGGYTTVNPNTAQVLKQAIKSKYNYTSCLYFKFPTFPALPTLPTLPTF